MGGLQTALKPLTNQKKFKQILMNILGPAESVKYHIFAHRFNLNNVQYFEGYFSNIRKKIHCQLFFQNFFQIFKTFETNNT